MALRIFLVVMLLSTAAVSQMTPIEPGVSQELARWRAARYSDVRYKLNLTLEKMSPVLKGTMEIRVKVAKRAEPPVSAGGGAALVLDWRKIKGFEDRSTIGNVSLNWKPVVVTSSSPADAGGSAFEHNEHLIFRDGVVAGENVIKLDFTSPILPSGSAITRYVDKEDGSEYIYSLFVPSDASTAFPVFDQPDLKARFELMTNVPQGWRTISNSLGVDTGKPGSLVSEFVETQPISTYVFAFAAGPFMPFSTPIEEKPSNTFEVIKDPPARSKAGTHPSDDVLTAKLKKGFDSSSKYFPHIYVRKSQAEKFKPHSAEVFRLNREAVKYFEEYFDYKFPFPKYDLVLIPEFPFGGMEHAGATFLREASVIFPQEPTRNDHINRATLIFHEAAHQWFGDTVTMRWFDDLWLKEGFATFTAYKALERIMPEMNAWKAFYERVKQGAYQTDSTRGTTPIYQEIPNLSAAKSAYGNIVYNKAPAFLRQAEFYLGEDKFRAAVRSFLKKHEFGNAGWEDLVKEFEKASDWNLKTWAQDWVKAPGLTRITNKPFRAAFTDVSSERRDGYLYGAMFEQQDAGYWPMKTKSQFVYSDGSRDTAEVSFDDRSGNPAFGKRSDIAFVFGNYGDYGYGIFLLDAKSRDYVLKNIQNEKDPFLRSMMWGALWDSVREGELDPREYVELVVKVLSRSNAFTRETAGGEAARSGRPRSNPGAITPEDVTLAEDESTTALLLNRVGTALNYYIDEGRANKAASGLVGGMPTAPVGLRSRVEDMSIAGMRNAPTQGQRITYYRAFLNVAASEKARGMLKEMLRSPGTLAGATGKNDPGRGAGVPLKTKDKFDIVTRLLILGDPEALALLAQLEKTETSDEAKRYAYAARAGIATAENKAKYWKDFTENKEISESWIEAAFGPWNSIRHSELTLPYLERALKELPNHKRNRKIFFVNGWLGAFIGGQRSEEALAIVNKFLADNPNLDKDLRLKILENVDIIERAVKIRK